ncbi:MAG: hypothetical protein HY692_00145, partial [Cyanobacteria bacterium NC_groundwater_1444_Ag_S-0.65um_54_12]|nr:hypothetical protein [Cyanobacteria bacterium NC_groundwater_1444_Ag_S-0.65um_54_12]
MALISFCAFIAPAWPEPAATAPERSGSRAEIPHEILPEPAKKVAARPSVHIVYTAATGGLYRASSIINEIWPLYNLEYQEDVTAGGLEFELGTLRHDRWYLWSPEDTLNAQTARAIFAGTGIALVDEGTRLPVLRSNYAVLFQLPAAESPWIVDWLFRKLEATGYDPDARVVSGALFAARSPDGRPLQIFSADGTPPPPNLLQTAPAWHWHAGGSALIRVTRGRRTYQLRAIGYRLGGPELHALAYQLKEQYSALRVDAGNLVGSADDALHERLLADTLAEVPKMGLAALVPYHDELRLPYDSQKRLAEAVPLVAANLIPPAGIKLQPYVIRTVNGLRIAIIGIADTLALGRDGLIGQRSGWQGQDPRQALEHALAEAQSDGVDGSVVVTNLREDRLRELREAAFGVAAVLTHEPSSSEADYEQSFVALAPGRTRRPGAWLLAGVESFQCGLLELQFRREASVGWQEDRTANPLRSYPAIKKRFTLSGLRNSVQLVRELAIADSTRSWRAFELFSDYAATSSEAILPDMRRLVEHDRRLTNETGKPQLQYLDSQWARIIASILRRTTDSELAIVQQKTRGSDTLGEIPRFIAENWIPGNQRLVLGSLTGAQIKLVHARNSERELYAFAGYQAASGLLGGRAIVDTERYRVVTVDALAASTAFRTIVGDDLATWLRPTGEPLASDSISDAESLRDVVLAYLYDLKKRHGGFSTNYLSEFTDLLLDDGTVIEPRWTIKVKPFEGSYQQSKVSNQQPFATVRNSSINTPDNSTFAAKGNLLATYETAAVDWENKLAIAYRRDEFQVP